MSIVGTESEQSKVCRWVEMKMQTRGESDKERILIRKLLIPEAHLKKGQNPTEHVIRGWAKYDDSDVESAVPFHGRWPAFLAGTLVDQKQLAKSVVKSKLGELECEGLSGWIQYKEDDLNTKVIYETRLHEKAPFGVVSSRMRFEVTRGGKLIQEIDSKLIFADSGNDARTEFPNHN